MKSRRFMGFLQLRIAHAKVSIGTGAEKLEMENGSVKVGQTRNPIEPDIDYRQLSSECLDLDQWSAPKTNVRFGSKADVMKLRCPLYPQKRTLVSAFWMSALGQKRTFKSQRALKKASEHCPPRCSGRLCTMSDQNFVDHVEHANSKLLWHWCEPWGGVQSRPGIGEPLLPSRLHVRAAELEIL